MTCMLETVRILERAASRWAKDHPRTVEYLTLLEESGARVGVFSSTLSAMVARELGIPTKRPPDDVDLLVHNDDFALVTLLLPNARVTPNKKVSVGSGDGHWLEFIADETIAVIPDEREVQCMRPQTLVSCSGHQYDTAYSDLAVTNRLIIETTQGIVPLAHPMDTLAMYALLQRNDGKNDTHNIATLLKIYSPVDDYAKDRADEMYLNQRVWDFMHAITGSLHGRLSVLNAA